MSIQILTLICIFSPLLASIIAGLNGRVLGPRGAHTITIAGVALAFVAASCLAKAFFFDQEKDTSFVAYQWASSGDLHIHVGFLLDHLSVLMMTVVTFVSLLVHIYSIGYMQGDAGYQRFFSYISLFTFAMLMLVSGDNLMQLFFGWEGVGLVSYLLIGFWFNRESANQGSLKAFLVNRVGDLGFIVGIATILSYTNSLDYATIFAQAPRLAAFNIALFPHHYISVVTLACCLLFVGAMGKSAQVPLHVWLPESMEGPTPISALIHAATMVTAGIYMVSRMSPLFEYSTTALSFVLIVGATGALFTGLLAVVQTDIKRVVAYSTLSQLGYMIASLGASAYAAGMFHLVTHACFKALLFLGAGSVIIAMHHDQDMRNMGGLRKYMPITYVTFLLGSLSLCAIPPFAGFFSKDAIIEAIGEADIFGSNYAYLCVLFGSFITALYTFRAFFMTFHTQERMDTKTREHLHESPWVVCLPLIILAIPSVTLGYQMVDAILYKNLLGNAIFVLPTHDVLSEMHAHYEGSIQQILEAPQTLPFWFALAGIFTAWLAYVKFPELPKQVVQRVRWFYQILVLKYGFDAFNQWFFVRGGRGLGELLFRVGDVKLIDGYCVNGSGRGITWLSRITRRLQSGYLYHYALVMIASTLALLWWIMR